ncbi:AEC family transporter [Cloacibacillus evryensis]|uniref:AEC family transporter n=1 Tax=Cloacibacillus evryensis TaxID=508460 RepID=UPI003AB4D45A
MRQPNLLIASTLCYIITIIAAYAGSRAFAHKGDVRRTAVSVFSSFRSNNIYLGFPVIQLAMGEAGLHEASIYVAVTTVSFQLLSIAAGEAVLYGRPSARGILDMLRKLVLNPLIISCVLGVIAAASGFPIHFVFDEAMKLMSGAATAVALLALGGSLDLSRMGKIVKILSRTWFDTLIKLAVNPAIMYAVLLLFPIPKDLFNVTVMLSAMPNAVNCFILARGMGMDSEYAADLVAATTLLGIISIPAWAYILGMV